MKYLWNIVYEWASDCEQGSVFVYAASIRQAIKAAEDRYSRPYPATVIKVERLNNDVIIEGEAK